MFCGFLEGQGQRPPLCKRTSPESEGTVDDDGTVNHNKATRWGVLGSDEFLLANLEPAPPIDPSNPGHESLDRLLAPVVVMLIFQFRKTLSTPEIWKEVSDPKPHQKRLNRVGDFLGEGRAKPSGCGQAVVLSIPAGRTS